MKGLYVEKYKALIKDVEDDSQKWKDTPCSSVCLFGYTAQLVGS